jgi:predicted unusual protein kinase regulating ubiquinone biosynthesis (AarF/ABC1/UbiB family)
MIFHGFFHGDVHAGNLMALDDGRIGFLDFGIVGRFSAERRVQITNYLVAFATGNYRRLAEVMVAMGTVDARVDLDELAKDLEVAYRPMLSMSFGQLNYGDLLPAVLRVSSKHRMHLPSEFVLVTKQMLYFDRYAKLLAPNLNIFGDPRLVAGLMEDVARAHMVLQGAGNGS